MKKLLMILCLAISLFMGCTKGTGSQAVGDDRDVHGCISSAGYSWCERTKQCERPWELAEKHGFSNTAEGFAVFCEAE